MGHTPSTADRAGAPSSDASPAAAGDLPEPPAAADVIVVGLGVIGAAIAWRLAQRGARVIGLDPSPGSGATAAAAGMLAPATEVDYGEDRLTTLLLAAAAGYPETAAELVELTGQQVGYRRSGAIQIAWDGADLAALRDLDEYRSRLGLASTRLTRRELRQAEPELAPSIAGGLLLEDDHQVDNRLLHAALLAALHRERVAVVRERAVGLIVEGGRVTGVRTEGGRWSAGAVVLAAGAWTPALLPDGAADSPEPGLGRVLSPAPVRPVHGTTIRLRPITPGIGSPNRIIRASVRGVPVYLVPRGDGSLVIGATAAEHGLDARPRASEVYQLLRDAQTVLPAVAELELAEVSTGLRPGSPDNAPIIGPVPGAPGLVLATGHYRNGVLLAPLTAAAVAELLLDGELPPELKPFTPDRFNQHAGVSP